MSTDPINPFDQPTLLDAYDSIQAVNDMIQPVRQAAYDLMGDGIIEASIAVNEAKRAASQKVQNGIDYADKKLQLVRRAGIEAAANSLASAHELVAPVRLAIQATPTPSTIGLGGPVGPGPVPPDVAGLFNLWYLCGSANVQYMLPVGMPPFDAGDRLNVACRTFAEALAYIRSKATHAVVPCAKRRPVSDAETGPWGSPCGYRGQL